MVARVGPQINTPPITHNTIMVGWFMEEADDSTAVPRLRWSSSGEMRGRAICLAQWTLLAEHRDDATFRLEVEIGPDPENSDD